MVSISGMCGAAYDPRNFSTGMTRAAVLNFSAAGATAERRHCKA